MKKALVLSLVAVIMFTSQLYGISVAEYIQQYGMPQVDFGILNLTGKNLTSLDGLQDIPSNILNQVRYLNLYNNQIQTLLVDIFNGLNNLKELDLSENSFTLDYIPALVKMIRDIPNLQTLNSKPKHQALKEPPFSTLFETVAERIVQNIEAYRPRLHELSFDIIEALPLPEQDKLQLMREKVQKNIDQYDIRDLDKLPLPRGERIKLIVEKIKKDIDAYRNRLHELPSEILDMLDLTPAQ